MIVCTCELSKHRGFDERTGHGLDQIVRRLRERSRTWHCLMQSFIPLRGLLVGNQAASISLWLQPSSTLHSWKVPKRRSRISSPKDSSGQFKSSWFELSPVGDAIKIKQLRQVRRRPRGANCACCWQIVQRIRRSSGIRRKTSAATQNVMDAAATVSSAAFRSGGTAAPCRRMAKAMIAGGWKI